MTDALRVGNGVCVQKFARVSLRIRFVPAMGDFASELVEYEPYLFAQEPHVALLSRFGVGNARALAPTWRRMLR